MRNTVGNGGLNVPIKGLLTDKFMQKFTSFKSLDDFFAKSPFAEQYEKDEGVESKELDLYVYSNSEFDNWQDMIIAAYIDYSVEENGAVML